MSKRRVLVVDDDEEDFRLVCDQLERCVGAEIEPVWSSSFADGLAVLAKESFHLCLVDLYLGADSGLDFIRAARAAGCHVPLILLTGGGNQEIDRAAQEAGAAYYVEKGALLPEQLERITRYCTGRPASPIKPAAGPGVNRRIGRTTPAPSSELPHILLVEDDEDDYLLTRDLLIEVFGSKLKLDWEASQGKALDRIAGGHYDVVIVDYRLGERNGLELVHEAVERGGSAPFIVLTGESSREIDLEAMRAGAMDYLVKGEITAPLLDRSIRYSIERHRAERRLADLAQLDQLTGLPNRYLLHDFLTRSLARADRQGHDVAVMLIDLDRFKPVNDVYGHGAGDRLLQALADRLQSRIRAGDLVARLGGDEFIIVITDVVDPKPLITSAERFLEAIGEPVDIGACEVQVGASIGIALYPTDADSLESLLVNADFAMYAAKEQRAGGLRFYTSEMRHRAGRRFSLERDLRQAVSHDELRLLFQPQIELSSGRLVGLEALVRWQHPEEGMIAPGEFIPVAEESDLILGIGGWVMRTACAQLAGWRAQGFPDIRVAVNLSARQLHHGEVYQLVSDMLAEHNLPNHLLELEITESHILQRPVEALKILGRLAEVGVRVALDDFGTGYSSLNHLRSFPGCVIKIDRSFICNICEKRNDAAIVRSLIEMAHDLDLKVVAEGVETPMQLDRLRAYGCDYVQGFLISKPLPADRISLDLLTTRLRHPTPGTLQAFAEAPMIAS